MFERSHYCGNIREEHIGEKITIVGWVDTRRDHGNIIFIDLRDARGILQIAVDPEISKAAHENGKNVRTEYVLSVTGEVRARPDGTVNDKLPTGFVEVKAEALEILSVSETPPFEISDETDASEELRMKYRYLDLRRSVLADNLKKRHKIIQSMRHYLDDKGFIEVETPILTKSTPEGARDYLVPSRVHEGSFFALPQSPQIFKQLLMISGCEKYFQIAKCFRDEDLRADRQPEFTQLDLEMSFVDEENIYYVIEDLLTHVFRNALDVELDTPFLRMSHEEAMSRYGSDKPDIRFDMEIIDLAVTFEGCEFKVFSNILQSKGRILALNAKGCAKFSRKEIDDLTEFVKVYGAKGLAWFKMEEGQWNSQITKFFKPEELEKLKEATRADDGDLIMIIADKKGIAQNAIGQLRLHIGEKENLIDKSKHQFLWVTDFPLFQFNEDEKRWESEHHPFTYFDSEAEEKLMAGDLEGIRSKAYDLVMDGVELGSGSIRIHKPDIQQKIFDAIGLSKEESKKRFGFLIEAFKYGAPPHGGIALGIDRFVTMIAGSESIRDVIAFPKTQRAVCPLTEAPSTVSKDQLKELGLKLNG